MRKINIGLMRTTAAVVMVCTVGAGTYFAELADSAQAHTQLTSGVFNLQINEEEANPVAYEMALGNSKLNPGEETTGTMTLQNKGDIDLYAWFASTTVTGGPEYSAALTADVSTAGGTVVRLPLATMNTIGEEFLIPAGGSLPVTIALSLPDSASNEVAGQAVDVVFNLLAAQHDPTPVDAGVPVNSSLEANQTYTRPVGLGTITYDAGQTLGDVGYSSDDLGPFTVVMNGSEAGLPGVVPTTNGRGQWTPVTPGTYELTYDIEERSGGTLISLTPCTITWTIIP